MKEKEIMQRAIDKWGKIAQLEMLQEEATELALATRKVIRGSSEERMDNFVSEITDVEIMIAQVKLMFPVIDEHIKKERVFKLKRLEKRLDANKFED